MTMLTFRSAADPGAVMHINLDRVDMIAVKRPSGDSLGADPVVQIFYADGAMKLAPQDAPAFLAALEKLLEAP